MSFYQTSLVINFKQSRLNFLFPSLFKSSVERLRFCLLLSLLFISLLYNCVVSFSLWLQIAFRGALKMVYKVNLFFSLSLPKYDSLFETCGWCWLKVVRSKTSCVVEAEWFPRLLLLIGQVFLTNHYLFFILLCSFSDVIIFAQNASLAPVIFFFVWKKFPTS